MHTKASLIADLRAMKLAPDDTLLVHSSMKSIGEVYGGADTVLDALMDYLGAAGLLVFPELSHRLNTENPIFEVDKTASQVGILPELFRQRPGVYRSLHPTHSVAAYGRDAREFVAGHEKFDTPAAPGSPWWRIGERQGKILFIGTKTMHCNTFLHGVEEWSQVPGMFRDTPHQLYVIDSTGHKIPVLTRRHNGCHSQYYDKMQPFFHQAGILTYPKFGDAACFLLEAAPARDLVLQLLAKDPLYFTHY